MFQMLGESIPDEFTKVIKKYLLTSHLFPELAIRCKVGLPSSASLHRGL